MAKEVIPNKILKNSGLKVAKTPDGKSILVPGGVTDDFKKVLNNLAIQGKQGATTSQFLNLFNYYLQNVLESKTAQRLDRYEQMDFIIENDPALSMTRRVLIDEMLQVDTYNRPITVTSPNLDFKHAIENLFSKLGVKSYLRELCSNLISYGDAFMIMDIQEKKGVTKLIPLDPRDVRHRFEFSLAELKVNKNQIKKKFTAFQAIIDLANTIETHASEFNKVLLGFQVLNTIFPFWQILHYRQFTTRNTLAPFGKPTFYESQSEARMYLNSKVIVSMIRSSAFMREHIKVKTVEDEDPSSQWEKCQQVKQQMELFINVSGTKSSKDYPSFGEKYYYPQGLIEIDKMEAGFNFRDKFNDLDILRQDVFTSTGLPKEYFVGGEQRQYVSAKSLIAQDKKAARQVFGLQSCTIDQLIKLVEVHFSYSGTFDPYKEEFAISLPYPVPDTDDSVVNLSMSKMSYAISTMDNLKNSLEITRIPEPLVRDLLSKYFPLKDEEINILIKQMKKDSSEEDKIGFNRIGMKAGDPFLQNTSSVVPPAAGQPPQQKLPANVQKLAAWFKNNNKPLEESKKEELFKMYQYDMNESYMDQFKKSTAKVPIEESLQKVMDKTVVSLGEEFVFGFRHYITNKYVSPDRNITGTSKESSQILKETNSFPAEKDEVEEKPVYNKVYQRTSLKEGSFVMQNPETGDVIKDTSPDKRYQKTEKII